jgi:hypothetical protein
MFGGKFRTTLRVPYAKKDSVIVEDWRSVRLDIQVRFCSFSSSLLLMFVDSFDSATKHIQSKMLYLTYLILNPFKLLNPVARVQLWKLNSWSTSTLYRLYWFSI